MNILIHVAVGNKNNPERWRGVCMLLTDFAKTLEKLGHNCLIYCHPLATFPHIHKNHILSENVGIIDFKPDKIIVWNGLNEGEKEIINLYNRENCIFGELGWFDHYNTCYFDFCGTNFTSMNLVEDLSEVIYNDSLFNCLVNKYKKPRLFKERYIFVPFQDENDTQILELSPFKRMNDLLEYVLTLYNHDNNIKILYKRHPHERINSVIDVKSPKLIEVTKDVHHYLPYAERVIGINSTVMFETLLYHQRILTLGIGFASRHFVNDLERKKYVLNCYNKQIRKVDLKNPDIIKESWFYKTLKDSIINE